MDDQKIIALLRTGESGLALNSLYKHFPMIRKLIRSKGGNSKDAEDIFQEALIILIRKAKDKDFKLTAQLSTYLFSVCRFLWKDQLNRLSNTPIPYDAVAGVAGLTGDAGSGLGADAGTGDPGTSLAGLTGNAWSGLTESEEAGLYTEVEKENRARLAEKVLQELKDRCREILLFFYQDRLSLKDIATRMGYSSENTAKNQKYKCLEAARNRLKELNSTTQTF
jgi:RNA polymerase sigma factor (sigma-70 family)